MKSITTHEEKCNFAIQELENAKIWKLNYNPPIIRLLHKLGFKVPFPHYNSFLTNSLLTGSWFCFVWGLFMYFFAWDTQNMLVTVIVIVSVSVGIFFGLVMACYYKYGFKKYKLTPWHEIKNV